MEGWEDFEVSDALAFSLNLQAHKGLKILTEKLGPLKAPSLRGFPFSCSSAVSV